MLGSWRTDNKAVTTPPVSALVVVNSQCGRGQREGEGTQCIVIATESVGVSIYFAAQEECKDYSFYFFPILVVRFWG